MKKMTDFSNPIFNSEISALEFMEGVRWPIGKICPHCGSGRIILFSGGGHQQLDGHRYRLHQCNDCRGHFTATVGTILHRSHIRPSRWLRASWAFAENDGNISAAGLQRILKCTYKTAWEAKQKLLVAWLSA